MFMNFKSICVFSNFFYVLNFIIGELVFDFLLVFDIGEYSCEVWNGYGIFMILNVVCMEVVEWNVGVIVVVVFVILIFLGILVFGIWFVYS